ncbi:UDP-N-acetylmuramoyl-L-alanyl-D-glutamate--2,6-diaminopimelate ligase [Pontiellaceae bacterium B12227]|nr:UDP-N-acetylmuramoyl-L-alanyl-D-glutamate--2,6-diaminopimelate ligase [Pontiellaceae bacterium B12227]
MKLRTLIESVPNIGTIGDGDPEVAGMTYDSRTVKPGWLFVAVSGHQVDGAEFITQAVSNGAVVVVSENALDLGAGVVHVQVKNARRAMAEIANAYYGGLSRSMTVVGVTGTNGKTTTTYMIRDILQAGGMKPGLLGTVAYEIGNRSIPAARTTPEAPEIHSMFQQMKEAGCQAAVMEVSSHAIALQRVHGIDFNVSVFTNLTQDHLDYHNDMDTYFNVKAELFQCLEKRHDHSAVINIDDPWGRKLVEHKSLKADVVTYGFHEKAAVFASNAQLDARGTRFEVTTPWGDAPVKLQLLGRFNIHNALAALAAGGLCGIGLSTMVKALENMTSVPGRLELVPNRKGKKIFVDYAHTDDALKNVLNTLREICKGKLVVVFGCGGNRDKGKRLKMGRVASELADYSLVTSDNPRNEEPGAIADDIVEGFSETADFEVMLDRQEAIEKAVRMIGRKDVLLIAGKGHETYQECNGAIIPFDDREKVRELIG